jgi:hypothetical protein
MANPLIAAIDVVIALAKEHPDKWHAYDNGQYATVANFRPTISVHNGPHESFISFAGQSWHDTVRVDFDTIQAIRLHWAFRAVRRYNARRAQHEKMAQIREKLSVLSDNGDT